MQIRIKRGLDLPCVGEPEQTIDDGSAISKVAVLGTDYLGLKPTMHAQVGDRVSLGQVLFTDKRYPEINRPLTSREYLEAHEIAAGLGLRLDSRRRRR